MSEVRGIIGSLDGGSRTPAPIERASPGTTIACRPFLWPKIGANADLAQVGKGPTSPSSSPRCAAAADRARSSTKVGLLEIESRWRCLG